MATTNGFSQTDDKDVSITASGSGKTQNDAKQAALRSSTEQAFGAFISSKTEMFNDQVVADQMASVSSGNIKSYEVLNESQLPDGSWGVTLKTIVSVDKLTSFVEAKGVAVEIKGGMFALNIKQQLLNEEGEFKVISDMVGLLHEPMQISFDYQIKTGEFISLDGSSQNWEIPIEVRVNANKNMDFCANYFRKTLAALSLTDEEVESYKNLGKQVFYVQYSQTTSSFNETEKWGETFRLRNRRSIYMLKNLLIQLAGARYEEHSFYTTLFKVETNEEYIVFANLLGSLKTKENTFHNFGHTYTPSSGDCSSYINAHNAIRFNFLNYGELAAVYTWRDKKTLSEVENLDGYTVEPLGVISHFKHGGYVVYESEKYVIASLITDMNEETERSFSSPDKVGSYWSFDDDDKQVVSNRLKTLYKNYNGYNDWQLPTNKIMFAFLVADFYFRGLVSYPQYNQYEINNYSTYAYHRTFGKYYLPSFTESDYGISPALFCLTPESGFTWGDNGFTKSVWIMRKVNKLPTEIKD